MMRTKQPISSRKKRLRTLGIGVLVLALLTALICLSLTYRIAATSPDGKLTIRIQSATDLGGLILPEPNELFDLIDHDTHQSRRVACESQGGIIGEWDHLQRVVWQPDGKTFVVICLHRNDLGGTYTFKRYYRLSADHKSAEFVKLL